MKKLCTVPVIALLSAGVAAGQARPLDWPFYGGDAQRSGWQKSDLRITRDNVKDFRLVLKRKLESQSGEGSLTPPVVIGNLISYKGFKELAFVQGSSGRIWSVDADIDRLFWQKQLVSKHKGCSGGAMGTPTLTPPTNFAAPRPRPAAAAGTQSPGAPPSPAATPVTAASSILGVNGFGSPRPAFAISSDGKLHILNTSTGDELIEPVAFLPENVRASSLTLSEGILYTTTTDCSGAHGTVWALDLNTPERKVSTYALKGAVAAGLGGVAIGTSGSVYVAGSDGSIAVLAPKDLTETAKLASSGAAAVQATPTIFRYKERDIIIAPTADGRLSLLDASQVQTAEFRTPPIGKIWGGISTWLDAEGARWVAAPVWGAVSKQISFPISNGTAEHGSIAVFRVTEPDGNLALAPAWLSRDLESPQPPVITSGVVFAVSAGTRNGHAALYAFDGLTGNEVYSTGDQVKSPANLNGIAIANGRVYFTTVDGTLYGFGIPLEI